MSAAVEKIAAQGIRLVLVCANEDCRTRILAVHARGDVVIQLVAPCPKCGRQSEYRCTVEGWDSALLKERPFAEEKTPTNGARTVHAGLGAALRRPRSA